MTGRKALTVAQSGVLDAVRELLRSRGAAPVRAIGEIVDIASPNGVYKHLDALEAKGYISRAGKGRTGIKILGEEPIQRRSIGDVEVTVIDCGEFFLATAFRGLDCLWTHRIDDPKLMSHERLFRMAAKNLG